MAQEKYSYYKGKILSGEDPSCVIKKMREDFGKTTDFSFNIENVITGNDIPFNIEREHLTSLIESKEYKEARNFIEDMKRTYRDAHSSNFIEVYEYHLNAVLHAEKNTRRVIEEAKKEFNQHTITIVSVVVGVITLLGTANQAFTVKNLNEGLKTFWSIAAAVLILIIFAFALNNRKD